MTRPLAPNALALFALPLAWGCTQGVGTTKHPDDSDDSHYDTAPSDTSIDDTAADGDLDNDGYTIDEGDCDDNNVYASPARSEDHDGIDNDCDGRVDEEWSGVDVVYANDAGAGSIFTLDTIGRVTDEVEVDSTCAPVWLDHRDGPLSDGTDDWVVNNGYAAVSIVDRDGTCTDLADYSESDSCGVGGVYGVATGLDGTIYATTLNGLDTIAEDGTVTTVASWGCDLSDVSGHELAAYSLAVDPLTGTVGLFGYFGGFGTYDPGTGTFTLLAAEDWETATLNTYSGAHRDGGGWYSPAVDATTGAYGIYKFNLEQSQWVQQEEWSDEDWVPFMLAMDGDTGDYYVTANAGWFYTVWRIVSGSGYAADLYTSDGTEEYRAFDGIVSNY